MRKNSEQQSLAIGIDIGGTNTVFGFVDRDGNISAKGSMPTGSGGAEAFVAALCAALKPQIARVDKAQVAGIGIGAPNGNIYTGEVLNAANLSWESRVPLAQMMQEQLGVPTRVTNDANAATVGEMIYGAAKGMKDFIMVTLGTGVGSGFVANGQLIYGHDGFAGELGHVIAVREGRPCGCGRHGCLETYTSASGMVRTAEEWLANRSEASQLRNLQPLTAAAITQAALEGDSLAQELFAFTGRMLGQTLADTVAITSPEAIILFGGLSKAGSLIFEPVKASLEASLLSIYRGKVRVLPSGLPDGDAAILGAAALVW